jgi:hypothetical protein
MAPAKKGSLGLLNDNRECRDPQAFVYYRIVSVLARAI